MSAAKIEERVAALERTVALLAWGQANGETSLHARSRRKMNGISEDHPTIDTPKNAMTLALEGDMEDEELVPDYIYMNLACERASNAPGPQVTEQDMVAYEGLGDFSYASEFGCDML